MAPHQYHPDAPSPRDDLVEQEEYSVALQRAIEHHCRGLWVPPDVACGCPHHAEKLNLHLAQEKAIVRCLRALEAEVEGARKALTSVDNSTHDRLNHIEKRLDVLEEVED